MGVDCKISHCSSVKVLSPCQAYTTLDTIQSRHDMAHQNDPNYATLIECCDKCKIQTLAGTGAHFIQETCPGHIAKQAARRHVPTNDTRWVSGVIWHVHTCTTCWVCHFQKFDNLNHAKLVLFSFWIFHSFFFFLILESLDGKLYLKAWSHWGYNSRFALDPLRSASLNILPQM